MKDDCIVKKLVIAIGLAFIAASCSGSDSDSATVDTAAAATVAPPAETPAPPPETAAPASQSHEFSVVNDAGVDISELYLSPGATAVYEDDILGDDVLLDGDSADFVVDGDESESLWDLLMVDIDGTSVEFFGIDLYSTQTITLQVEWFGATTGEGTAILS